MRRQLCAGSMLLKDGIQLPEFLEVGTEEYSPGWSFISESTSADLGSVGAFQRKIQTKKFYMFSELLSSGYKIEPAHVTTRESLAARGFSDSRPFEWILSRSGGPKWPTARQQRVVARS